MTILSKLLLFVFMTYFFCHTWFNGSSENHRLELEKVPKIVEFATNFHDPILSIITLLASPETNQPVLTPKLKDISDSFRLCRLSILPCSQTLTCDVCDQTIDVQKSIKGHMLKNHQAEANLKCDVYSGADIIGCCYNKLSIATLEFPDYCQCCTIFSSSFFFYAFCFYSTSGKLP